MNDVLVAAAAFAAGFVTVALRRQRERADAAATRAARLADQLAAAQDHIAQMHAEQEIAAAQITLLAAATQAATTQAQRAGGVDVAQDVRDRFCWN